ncbi:MAG: helix-turn-helix domain-containing protein [Bacteroidota bacterium]|nr:helix-turn-helix domain-containing protein [Bacteroidota bacterium]
MNISLTNILFVLIIFQLLFLSLFLFAHQKGRKTNNLLLGFFFLSISLNLLDVFLLMTGAYTFKPYLAGWGSCFPLLFGPFIYFYVQSVLNKNFTVAAKSWIHFSPFIILFIIAEFLFLTQPRNIQEKLLSDLRQHHFPHYLSMVSTLIFIQFFLYIISSLRLVSLYKKVADQYFSNSKQTDIYWLSAMIIFFLIIVIVTIVNGLLAQTSLAPYYLTGFNIIILAILVFVIMIQLKTLQEPYFLSFSEDDDISVRQVATQNTLPDAGRIEKEKISQLALNYMQDKKPFLEPELNLEQLASQLLIKPKLLSQAINEILGQNFYDFINRHRIEEAARLLTNPKDKKITVLEVLYEVGFNSKSSFNTLFKKYTGQTPTEFRRKRSG